jgi:plasmid stabilization system protein ParE
VGGPEARKGTREILFPPLPYVAVYRATAQTIEILRVYHTAQERP